MCQLTRLNQDEAGGQDGMLTRTHFLLLLKFMGSSGSSSSKWTRMTFRFIFSALVPCSSWPRRGRAQVSHTRLCRIQRDRRDAPLHRETVFERAELKGRRCRTPRRREGETRQRQQRRHRTRGSGDLVEVERSKEVELERRSRLWCSRRARPRRTRVRMGRRTR